MVSKYPMKTFNGKSLFDYKNYIVIISNIFLLISVLLRILQYKIREYGMNKFKTIFHIYKYGKNLGVSYFMSSSIYY